MVKGAEPSKEIAEFARSFSDATRVKILLLLAGKKRGMTTMDICTRLGLPEPRVSSHLSVLLKSGVVSVDERGRQRVYTLSSYEVSSLVNDLASLSVTGGREGLQRQARPVKVVRADSPIRQCRSCYDHLAGATGVELLERMAGLGWLRRVPQRGEKGSKPVYQLTRVGQESLRKRGVDVERASRANRMFAFGCLDWTERRPHLGGALGAAILDSALARGIVERRPGTRALRLAEPITSWMEAC